MLKDILAIDVNKKDEHAFVSVYRNLEAPSGFEPENEGFADLYLTAWLWRHK